MIRNGKTAAATGCGDVGMGMFVLVEQYRPVQRARRKRPIVRIRRGALKSHGLSRKDERSIGRSRDRRHWRQVAQSHINDGSGGLTGIVGDRQARCKVSYSV